MAQRLHYENTKCIRPHKEIQMGHEMKTESNKDPE